jgi:hypothetical protein
VNRREAWLSAASIFGLALVVRAIAAASLAFPIPEDTTYYSGVARNLVEGRGLVSNALWSYQTPPLVLPRPAFEVWLPLPTLLAAVPIWIAGAANWFRAAQVFSVLTGAVVAALAWRLGADVAAEMRLPVGRARTLAVGSGVVASVLGPLVVYGALADSTALFAALSLGACLLMTRLSSLIPGLRAPARSLRALDRRLLALGLIFGLAALTRSDAIWLGLAWLIVVWRWTPGSIRERLPLVLVPAAVAALIYAPWAVRDWVVFGTPLPSQTLANALSVNNRDIFAYLDQPTLSRYLAQGPAVLLGMRVNGTLHNLLNVLVMPAFPVGAIGLLALPWTGRLRAVRPLLLAAAATFLAASLIFPVSTLWGTFLHAAGAIFVLLAVSCLVALDASIAWIGQRRHWTRPVAWLGAALAVAVTVPLMVVSMRSLDREASRIQAAYAELPAAMARAGVPLSDAGPVISDHPIWLTESAGVPALALPEESPEAVLDLARRFGATLLVVQTGGNREWPGILEGGSTAAQCFRPVPLTDYSGESPADEAPLGQFHVFRIACP